MRFVNFQNRMEQKIPENSREMKEEKGILLPTLSYQQLSVSLLTQYMSEVVDCMLVFVPHILLKNIICET